MNIYDWCILFFNIQSCEILFIMLITLVIIILNIFLFCFTDCTDGIVFLKNIFNTNIGARIQRGQEATFYKRSPFIKERILRHDSFVYFTGFSVHVKKI